MLCLKRFDSKIFELHLKVLHLLKELKLEFRGFKYYLSNKWTISVSGITKKDLFRVWSVTLLHTNKWEVDFSFFLV